MIYEIYVNYMRMIYEIYGNYIVDIWQMRHDIWDMIYRKTVNFRVVQFLRNFAVSIDRSGKIKIREIFHIFGKISVEELVAIWITYSPAVRPVICSYLKTMSLQAILLEVNWSMTDPIYSVSRWLIFSFVVVFDTVIVLVSFNFFSFILLFWTVTVFNRLDVNMFFLFVCLSVRLK